MSGRPHALVLTAALAAAMAGATEAAASIQALPAQRSAAAVADAISAQPGLVRRAWFSAAPPASRPVAVSTTRLAGFPRPRRSSGRFAILSTGDATLAGNRNDSTFTGRDAGGPSIRGAFDVTILRLDLRIPRGATCVSFDVRLLSDEYREAIGTQFGDMFVAELGESNWRIGAPPDTTLSAPRNVATSAGQPLTIADTGFSAMSRAGSAGTTYDGGTRLIRVAGPVSPGDGLLFMSILERGDRLYDTSAFIDNLRTSSPSVCSTRPLG